MDVVELIDPPVQVRISRNPRARRFTLRLDSAGRGAVLTVPPGVPDSESKSFLVRHADWLRRALARQPQAVEIDFGATLPVAGIPVVIAQTPDRRRAPTLVDGQLLLTDNVSVGPRVAQWLKLRARDALQPAVHGYAAQLGKQVKRIALRDTKTRWGSCSTSGTLSFSWRLAMAPPEVLDYVAAHEAAHMVEMNHSPAYWAVVARLMPDWKPKRAWLKRHGRDLHKYRF